MKYTVVSHRAQDSISVSVPGLPGCWSEGDTEEEALENIRIAIQEYLAAVSQISRDQERYNVEVARIVVLKRRSPWVVLRGTRAFP